MILYMISALTHAIRTQADRIVNSGPLGAKMTNVS